MAGGTKERRMVFDVRGRRKTAVKVVYAVLALLMGASLFLTVGPVNLGNLFGGTSGSSGAAAKAAEEQAQRFERKLAKDPEDPDLLLGLTRARLQAAQTSVVANPETGEAEATLATTQQYEKASEAWDEYLKVTDEPSVGAAQLVAQGLFTLAQISRSPTEIASNMQAAADTQKLVVEKRPNLSTLSNYAVYSTYAFDYGEAKKAADKVKKLANSKFERENFENSFEETTKTAKSFQKELARLKKQNKGAGKESLENPLSGIGPLGE